jgi:PAS domain S-box-containing protein
MTGEGLGARTMEVRNLSRSAARQVSVRGTSDQTRASGAESVKVTYRADGAGGELHSLVRQASEFWQSTVDSLTAHIAVLDEYGTIVAVNAAWRRVAETEAAGSERVGSCYMTMFDGSSDPHGKAVAEGLRDLLAGDRETLELEYPRHGPVMQRWFSLHATRDTGSGPVRVVLARQDITARRQAEQRASMHAALLDEIDVSVIVTDLNLIVLSWSSGAERLYGWSAQDAIGRSARDTIWPSDGDAAPDEQEFEAALQREGRSDGEYTVRRKDGSTFPAHVRSRLISDQDGQVTGVVSVAMDITERKGSERALLSARNYLRAVTDSMGEGELTCDVEGLLTSMNQAAEDLLGWSSAELLGRPLHAVMHHRRADGSPLPLEDCPILRARRDGEIVRVEDDIFICRDASELPVAYTAAPLSTDRGMEGCVVVFADITERKAAAQRVERDLQKLASLDRVQLALAENRFVLHAQPIIDLHTGHVVQRELLLRMRAPEIAGVSASLIAPGAFLPVAEEFGLITEIDRWVIDRSTEIAATGEAVQINVSARSVSDPSLVDYIKHAIERNGADPGTIVFEITETVLVSDQEAARTFVERLHDFGCKIALDDFGTGYGGFTYVKQLPVDFLKIDIEFVGDLTSSSASRHVVEAVVDLAARFGLQTVGEGVEDQETLDLLRELGVDYAQGYHIGRPAALQTAQPSHQR